MKRKKSPSASSALSPSPRASLGLLKLIFASQPLAATAEGKYWFSLGSGNPRWQCGPLPASTVHTPRAAGPSHTLNGRPDPGPYLQSGPRLLTAGKPGWPTRPHPPSSSLPLRKPPSPRVSIRLPPQEARLLSGLGNLCPGWDEAECHEPLGAHPQWPPNALLSSATAILMW